MCNQQLAGLWCLLAVLQAAAEAKHTAKPPAPTSAADHSSFKTPAPPKAATRLVGADAGAAAAGAKVAAAAGDSPSLTITVLEAVSTGVCWLKQDTAFYIQQPDAAAVCWMHHSRAA
jgi:hypothetical protein